MIAACIKAAQRWVALALALTCCTPTDGPTTPPAPTLPPIVDPPTRAGLPTILIVEPDLMEFRTVRERLVSEVQDEYNISTLMVTSGSSVADIEAALKKTTPKCVVLMNNHSVHLYREYQKAHREKTSFPAALIVMTSFLERLRPTLTNATGIVYEVPGVTSFIYLRTIMKRPLTKIGVVFRSPFQDLVVREKALAKREQFELVPALVPKRAEVGDLRRALESLVTDAKVDALWMLNDNGLLKNADFFETWNTISTETNLPLVVGVPNLVDAETPLGTFAAVPDLDGLGLQAANMLFELADSDWSATDYDVELPLTVKTFADAKQMRERFGIGPGLADMVDHVVE